MLLDDIIDLATNTGQSITVLLRKCIVLAHQIKNDRLKTWANKELNGYGDEDVLPDYRVISARRQGALLRVGRIADYQLSDSFGGFGRETSTVRNRSPPHTGNCRV
jgi:hypothetical protein